MQASSPLAALQPQQVPWGHAHGHWNLTIDRPVSSARSGPACVASFNFKDLSMHNSRPASAMDYFSKPSYRGSSPTANLAVDLSKNFHIDQSPLPPTPRRSLLDLFGKLDRPDSIITPPIPATSPCPEIDMDSTPLPHKNAFSAQINIFHPTPQPSPGQDEDVMMTSPLNMPASPCGALSLPSLPEMKKLKPRPARLQRPEMKKAWSHSGGGLRTAPLEKPAPFLFGTHGYKSPQILPLGEAFHGSPSPEKENIRYGLMSAESTPVNGTRPRSANLNRQFGTAMNGSPVGPLARRPGASKRAKTCFRRTSSMYEHPDKWMSDKQTEMCMEAIAESNTQPELVLPHHNVETDGLPRITQETLIDVLDGKYASQYDASQIIDCRFEYEFDGGHINGAQNCTDREGFANSFWSANAAGSKRTLLIFHCEFSEKRAPTTAMYFRSKDREVNAHRYPFLSFPDVYILEGGYSSFFKQHRARCYPQEHVAMEDARYSEACERGLGRIKRPQKLGRAATFAFGERDHVMNESPTAMPRNASVNLSSFRMDISPISPSVTLGMGGGLATRRAMFNTRTISH